jgi:uncharacterized SAM-binding protein YcdF (DUF218 family)
LSGINLLLLTTGKTLDWRSSRSSRWLCIAALSFAVVFDSTAGARILVWSLESRYPDAGLASISPAQAIVVLGGASHATSDLGKLRLVHAFQLYQAGKAPVVLCSGGGSQFPDGTTEAAFMAKLLQEWHVPPEAILMEERSRNTRENAFFSSPVLKARGIHHILLVTSALHMPRAAAVFQKIGFQVIPAATEFQKPEIGGWLPTAADLQRSNAALREWIGLLEYRLLGWA